MVNGDISYVILDTDSLLPHPVFSLRNPMLIMRMVRSVDADPLANGVQAQFLATTTENSWAELGYAEDEMPSPDLGVERIGNVPIIAVSEVTDAEAISVLPLASEQQTEFEQPTEDEPQTEAVPDTNSTPENTPADFLLRIIPSRRRRCSKYCNAIQNLYLA